ncbi:MAG: thrombospondin type 3 repeat-containing protein [Myxococcota bacterium]
MWQRIRTPAQQAVPQVLTLIGGCLSLLVAGAPLELQAAGVSTVGDSFTDRSKLNTSSSSNYQLVSGSVRQAPTIDVGSGADGTCTVGSGSVNLSVSSCAGRSTADAIGYRSTTSTAAGASQLTVASTPTGISSGDDVLIIHLQGTSTSFSNVGKYELRRVVSIAGNTLSFDAPLNNPYDGTTQKIMVQRVPNYTNVSISVGATLTANGWDGNLGGVLPLRATGTVTVAGSINMTAKGYSGGVPNNSAPWNYGQPGESLGGVGPQSSTSSTVFAANIGGGGGADPGNCGPVWPLSGGGGAYGTAGSTGSTVGCGTSPSSSNIAKGGTAYGAADLSTLHLGSGGGAGGSDIGLDGGDCHTGGAGGGGGGVIFIQAGTLTVTGSIVSNGANGVQDRSSGGAGAGGSIWLGAQSMSLGTNLVTALGGTSSSDPYCPVTAGLGGAGRIALYYGNTPVGSTNPTATSKASVSFLSPALVTSVNLLSGQTPVDIISRFAYTLSALPSNTSAIVQFSQNGSTWFNSGGVSNGTDSLLTGAGRSLDLSGLGLQGANFYYRVTLTSDGKSTPILDDITVTWCGDPSNTDGDTLGDACDTDDDNDSVADTSDNCPLNANTAQTNTDGDTLGDACDTDDDNDSVADGVDNCPLTVNADQADLDEDAQGDLCDADDDDDAVLDVSDNCPRVENTDQLDTDLDTVGDACDADDDNDTVMDGVDNCPLTFNETQADLDQDGFGDACDSDDDNDTVLDVSDNCPQLVNPAQTNTDGDTTGDVCDPDDDNDTVMDGVDNCPLLSNANQLNTDGDGEGDACDADDDNDGVADNNDNCITTPNAGQENQDGDAFGDACDLDLDGDEVNNGSDNCPFTANAAQADLDGDGAGDLCDADADGDTVSSSQDCNDLDATSSSIQTWYADPDADALGDLERPISLCAASAPEGYVEDSSDNCVEVFNPEQTDTDLDGLGNACDEDDDDDTILDEQDNCPLAANPEQLDTDGNGVGDRCENDVDGDAIADDLDNCPEVSNVDQLDFDEDGQGDACDGDADNDGTLAGQDCDDFDPSVANEGIYYSDVEGDGFGDASAPMTACVLVAPVGYVSNGTDNCPTLANPEQGDLDEDGQGDACDADLDGDTVQNLNDNCPEQFNPDQLDADQDGEGDVCDGSATPTPTDETPTPTDETPTPTEPTSTPTDETPTDATPTDATPTPGDLSPEPSATPSTGGGCSCNTSEREALPWRGAGLLLLALTFMGLRRRTWRR